MGGLEQWDDGNTANGDGWSSIWKVESGWSCSGAPSIWYIWGNGIKEGTEAWDDGNVANGDGCSILRIKS